MGKGGGTHCHIPWPPRASQNSRRTTKHTCLEEEEQRGEGAGSAVGGAVGAGVALDVVVPRAAAGKLALWCGGYFVFGFGFGRGG